MVFRKHPTGTMSILLSLLSVRKPKIGLWYAVELLDKVFVDETLMVLFEVEGRRIRVRVVVFARS